MRGVERGAVRWCRENRIGIGDIVQVEQILGIPTPARVTGFGESVVVLRRRGCAEFLLSDPARLYAPGGRPAIEEVHVAEF